MAKKDDWRDTVIVAIIEQLKMITTTVRPRAYLPITLPTDLTEVECQCGLTLKRRMLKTVSDALYYLGNDVIKYANHRLNSDCNRESVRRVYRKFVETQPYFELTKFKDLPPIGGGELEERWVLQRCSSSPYMRDPDEDRIVYN